MAPSPDGASFWTTGGSQLFHIDILTGELLGTISPSPNVGIAGLALFGEYTVPVHPIIFVHGINQNLNEIGVPQADPTQDKFVPLYRQLLAAYGPSNLTSFQYLDDRALAEQPGGCPAGIFPPCQSQSSVTDNGLLLAEQINTLYAQTQHKVTLIGYSMGGAIIRTALAGCPNTHGNFDCAGLSDLVDNVVFHQPGPTGIVSPAAQARL